jgi:hypothetical protein
MTIGDGDNTVIFEYNKNLLVGLGHVAINIGTLTTAAEVRDATMSAINGIGTCEDSFDLCALDTDCPGLGTCQGGPNNNDPCDDDVDCPSGTCEDHEQCIDFSIDINATAGIGTTIINLVNGEVGTQGNVSITETLNDVEFAVTGMAGGAGRDCIAGTGCKSNDDCVSGVCNASKVCN